MSGAQEAQSPVPPAENQAQEPDPYDESRLYLNLPENETADVGGGGASGIWLFVRMVVVLAIVAACIYALVFFLKKGLAVPDSDDPYLRKTASLALAPGKSVQVITLGERAYLIGVADNAVQLLAVIDDADLVSAMNLNAEKHAASRPHDFASVLERFLPKREGGEESKTEQARDFLQQQKDRLKNLGNSEHKGDDS